MAKELHEKELHERELDEKELHEKKLDEKELDEKEKQQIHTIYKCCLGWIIFCYDQSTIQQESAFKYANHIMLNYGMGGWSIFMYTQCMAIFQFFGIFKAELNPLNR